ncbi:unnamed protein product [Notodromas monacha]|uniref:Uncharacterized protein n=1 Tax=Notodromas monacha TaxID=399045 RepID=A0A7R9C2L1_9CRUS|nr:unnamed protein product [Notodromas monacha]CAG0924986.1 unnamed protein product [Notodromas monacha]
MQTLSSDQDDEKPTRLELLKQTSSLMYKRHMPAFPNEVVATRKSSQFPQSSPRGKECGENDPPGQGNYLPPR